MKKRKNNKKLKKKRIRNTRKKRGNNNHNKNNNGNRISQFINKEPKSLNPIITNDIEEDFKMMSDDISGELGDFYWNIFRFKDVLETFLIGEVGIVIEAIDFKSNTGKVRVGFENWKALTKDRQVIKTEHKVNGDE